jgi:hypothetical protein
MTLALAIAFCIVCGWLLIAWQDHDDDLLS